MGSKAPETSYILYFGDQTERNIPLGELFEFSKTSVRTRKFLQDAFRALELVKDTLDKDDRAKYNFKSFEEAEQRLATDSSPDVVLRTIILCVAQIGYLIATLEKDPILREIWAAQEALIVASCAGQLPAAIAASTQTIDELVTLAPETVAISFRIGLDVDRRTSSLSNDRSQSWAKAVGGISVAEAQIAIDSFLSSEGIEAKQGVYVAATSAWATTIVGPPHVLNLFFSTDPFKGARQTDLPITATFHASHLDKPDTAAIIGKSSKYEGFSLKNAQFFSCSSGLPFQPQTLSDLVAETILNISHRMTDNERMFGEVQTMVNDRKVRVRPIVGESGAERLRKALTTSDALVEKSSLVNNE